MNAIRTITWSGRRIGALGGAAAVAAVMLVAPAASAADRVVATVAKQTGIYAHGDRAVWSAWDPAVDRYRLTEYADGRVRTLPIKPGRVPFDVDLGPGPDGHMLAVFSRCKRPPQTTWQLNGRRGCDLRVYDFHSGRERAIGRANSTADERWPAVWHNRIAFTRTYRPRDGRTRRYLYWRPLHGRGASDRLDRGPLTRGDAVPEQLDMNRRRVAFTWTYEYGADLRLDWLGGRERRLVRIPGSGAAVNTLAAQGPRISGRDVHWMLSVGSDAPVFSEIRRHGIRSGRDTRATQRIDADPSLPRATEGFGQGGGASWYVRAAAAGSYEIHRTTGLDFEKAPPIELE